MMERSKAEDLLKIYISIEDKLLLKEIYTLRRDVPED
jgi:hypothetical protein